VEVEWHGASAFPSGQYPLINHGTGAVPSKEEITFILEIIENIAKPLIEIVDSLIGSNATWDNVARNDFCR
jgi:hypothetical protein